jgi:Leucine-rich repeat (LRR) protein
MRVGPPLDQCTTARGCLALAVLALVGCRDCSSSSDESPSAVVEQAAIDRDLGVQPSVQAAEREDIGTLRLHHADEIGDIDLGSVEVLDLALSVVDQLGHLDDRETETACDGLDLERLAASAPRLRSLRVSGCSEAVSLGLAGFGGRLESLTLADMALDAGTVSGLSRLGSLERLALIRVEPTTEDFRPLSRLTLRNLELHELGRDSELGSILELWPRSLRGVVLVGEWAGHKAMTSLSKAEALEAIELRDTRVGNYSLNQIKPLPRLRHVSFAGETFNDNSPLYFRELPVTYFECACPRFGDGGLRSLRHSSGLQSLVLRQTQISAAGLAILPNLKELRTLVIHDRDIGNDGLRALADLRTLEWLELSGSLEHARFEHLGELTTLRGLILDYREIDDRIAPHLAKLVHLEHLALGGTRISDDSLAALDSLPSLRVLRLDRTRVTNRGLAHVGKLSALEVLTLDQTDVVDAGVAHLAGLANLRELTLDHTLVTDRALDYLLGMRQLERLGLGGTVVTAEGVAKLAQLPSLRAVNLADTRAAGSQPTKR